MKKNKDASEEVFCGTKPRREREKKLAKAARDSYLCPKKEPKSREGYEDSSDALGQRPKKRSWHRQKAVQVKDILYGKKRFGQWLPAKRAEKRP